jgi:hypothetical protein
MMIIIFSVFFFFFFELLVTAIHELIILVIPVCFLLSPRLLIYDVVYMHSISIIVVEV